VEFRGQLAQGTVITFTFPEIKLDDQPATMDGEVIEFDPPRRFAFTWGGDELRFELAPARGGDACHLRLTVALDDREKAARDGAGWHVCLNQLERSLSDSATQGPGTEITGEWRHEYDEYVRRGFPAGAELPEDG
jgi:hypothetical protein